MATSLILNIILLAEHVLARRRHDRSTSTCVSDVADPLCLDFKDFCLEKPKRNRCELPKPCITPCTTTVCDLPFNCFSITCAYKLTEAVYLAIKNRLLPNINFCRPTPCVVRFYERSNSDLELQIAKLLQSVVSTVPPAIFDRYYNAFNSGNYYECFIILQRFFNTEAELERVITEGILRRNKPNRRRSITAICFVDPCTKECSVIELPGCECANRVCLYLPSQVLKFEEFICLPFSLDEAIICELDYFVPVGFKKFYKEILIKYFKCFRNLTLEQKIIWWLRIKFFVFNSIGYTVSYLSSGAKNQVLDLLIKTATSENDAFYLSYARSLGIITTNK